MNTRKDYRSIIRRKFFGILVISATRRNVSMNIEIIVNLVGEQCSVNLDMQGSPCTLGTVLAHLLDGEPTLTASLGKSVSIEGGNEMNEMCDVRRGQSREHGEGVFVSRDIRSPRKGS